MDLVISAQRVQRKHRELALACESASVEVLVFNGKTLEPQRLDGLGPFLFVRSLAWGDHNRLADVSDSEKGVGGPEKVR